MCDHLALCVTRGFVGGTLGLEVHHEGVVRLLDAVGKRGYSVMYLTARSLGFDITTRDYLFKVCVLGGVGAIGLT